ncbi:MAG: hypothetical protein AAGG48_00645 [Planctomycetota bacterium]
MTTDRHNQDVAMSLFRKLHELHQKHENLWWIMLAVIAATGLLLLSGNVIGFA